LSIPASLLAAPPDDVGAQTADRYDWQALVAAVDCIAAMTECASKSSTGGSTEVWVICEHHEDFVLSVGGSVQLVSVKHREPGLGGWTRASLFAAGGVAHLFSRWLDLQELVSVRVATNAGLSNDLGPLTSLCSCLRNDPTGQLEKQKVGDLNDAAKRIINSTDADVVAKLGWKQGDGSPTVEFVDCVRRFLTVLTLDCERPHRPVLPSAAVSMYVAPFLAAVGRDPGTAARAWGVIANLFRQRMRGHLPPATEGLTTIIRNIRGLTVEERIAIRLSDRMVTDKDILEALELAESLGLASTETESPFAPTRLALKLFNAGCQATTIHAAEAAARRWRNHESALSQGAVGILPTLERIKTRTLVIASGIQEEEAEASDGAD